MNKPVFGMLLGGVLGVFDGFTALVSAPETAPQIASIVFGSTIKGLMTGVLIGVIARRVRSLAIGVVAGLALGVFFAYLVCLMQVAAGEPAYYWEIMLPGGVLGVIVGYATYYYGDSGRRATVR